MKRDRDQLPTRSEHIDRVAHPVARSNRAPGSRRSALPETFEWPDAFWPPASADRVFHKRRELCRRNNRLLLAFLHDSPGNLPRTWFLAVFAKECTSDISSMVAINSVGRGMGVGIHPHVERTIGAERESALGIVELKRRKSQIKQNPIHAGESMLFGDGLRYPKSSPALERADWNRQGMPGSPPRVIALQGRRQSPARGHQEPNVRAEAQCARPRRTWRR